MVVGLDIKVTEKGAGPATAQISVERDDIQAVIYVMQLQSELASTPPTDICDEGFPVRLKEVF